MTFPDDSIQGINGKGLWKKTAPSDPIRVGTLLRANLPYVGQIPFALVPEGRDDPTDHSTARIAVKQFRPDGKPPQGARELPVAALPLRNGEVLLVQRAKVRPVVVIATEGQQVPDALRRQQSNSSTSPSLLVAPFYGVKKTDKRHGFDARLVERIRHGEYSQYFWDVLPLPDSEQEGSVLRLDQLQAIGHHQNAYNRTGWGLNETGLTVLAEWREFHMTGKIRKDGFVEMLQTAFGGP